jgi:hypothetical protein
MPIDKIFHFFKAFSADSCGETWLISEQRMCKIWLYFNQTVVQCSIHITRYLGAVYMIPLTETSLPMGRVFPSCINCMWRLATCFN